jgi:hypothetical protein
MQNGWKGYFAMCPDYWVRIDLALMDRNTMLVSGEAGGTINGKPWRTPAAWKAVFHNAHIVEWHLFADNKPVYDILSRLNP